jgi:hypothetical protein
MHEIAVGEKKTRSKIRMCTDLKNKNKYRK